jgi:hypothetical protein
VLVGATFGFVVLVVLNVYVLRAVTSWGVKSIRSATASHPVDAQAARLAAELQDQLRVISWSPGHITGGWHTEGDFVVLTQSLGGAVLSFSNSGVGQPGGMVWHVADVMLGVIPPATQDGENVYDDKTTTTTAPACYQLTFGDASLSVQPPVAVPCPMARPNGGQDSVAWLAALLAAGSQASSAPSVGYPPSTAGLRDYVDESFRLSRTRTPALSTATGGGVLAAAFRHDGACFYVRMSAQAIAPPAEADAVWLAPAQSQGTACDGSAALAAAVLYGVNGASEG